MTTSQDTINIPSPLDHQDTEVASQNAGTKSVAGDTPADNKEHWIARVVRQMQGCSPSKIDSVIQANLPPRKIRWSQRPDTLCIPGLEGRLPYTVDSLKWEYDPGFFRNNKLMHPELPALRYGIEPQHLTHTHVQHDLLLSTLILCFAMLSVLMNSTRHFLQTRARDFFYTNNSIDAPQNDRDTVPLICVLATYMLLCAIGALFAMYYATGTQNLVLCSIPRPALLAVYAGCFALMFGSKRLLSGFINWIFFDKNSRRQWRLDYNFLLIVESATLLPIVTGGICFALSADTVSLAGLAVVFAVKITLLYKAFQIFLPKIYGIVHLLSYLCALEIMPLLALWVGLHGITEYLTITF